MNDRPNIDGREPVQQLEHTRIRAGLDVAELAEVIGADVGVIRSWLAGASTPGSDSIERARQVTALLRRLEQVVTEDHVPAWLRRPSPALDGQSPLEALAASRYTAVSRLLAALEDPSGA